MEGKDKISYIKHTFQSGDDNKISEAISLISESEMHDAIPFLLILLKNTGNSSVRDEAALALSDLNVVQAIPVLFELITDPKNINHRGTLLYSLQQFDCRQYMIELSKVLCDGNFETQEMIVQIFEEIEEIYDKNNLAEAIKVMEKCSSNDKTERQNQYVSYSIELLKDLL